MLDDIEGLLTENRIFKQRNVDIGKFTLEEAMDWGLSGVMIRSAGAAWDLRRAQPYECYSEMDFDIPIGKNGDCYDRYLMRMAEMRESVKIMKAVLREAAVGRRAGAGHGTQQEGRAAAAGRDEALDGGAHPPLQALHRGLPRARRRGLRRRGGAEGRVRRVPGVGRLQQALSLQDPGAGLPHLQALDPFGRKHMLADMSALIGSFDIVFGEIDR